MTFYVINFPNFAYFVSNNLIKINNKHTPLHSADLRQGEFGPDISKKKFDRDFVVLRHIYQKIFIITDVV